MKTPDFLLIYSFVATALRQASADCLNGGMIFDVTACSYEALLSAYTSKFNDPVYSCYGSGSAESDLWVKLGGVTSLPEAQAYVNANICSKAYISREYIPFTQAANKGVDYEFEKRYFNGKSDWNERVETLYGPKGVGVSSYNLQDDTRTIQTFQGGLGRTEQVEFPSRLSNFESCASNTVYCCFVTDRQANDGNGNCATPYDLNCVDKDPGDNTDLCYVDHSSSKKSNGVNSSGEATFSGDDDNNSDRAEGPVHCHGFAWANDSNDYTSRYKGNTLHFVSMFDHMNQRGYVRAVPGAPMCACAEQMPVVSRADCTEVTPKEYYQIIYTGQGWGAKLTTIELTFAACNGYNGNNNNLFAYMQRLYFIDKKVNASQLALLSKYIVGNNNCDYATSAFMQAKGYAAGYQESTSPTGMTQLAGRGLFFMDGNMAFTSKGNMGDSSFMTLYKSSPTGIILRICQDCEASHQKIYVRFNSGYGPNEPTLAAPFFKWLKENTPQNMTMVGEYGVAWLMYSTYEDALARTNPWQCPNYNAMQVFPGDCDPVSGTKLNQFSRFEPYYDGKIHAAWYIDSTNPFVSQDQRKLNATKNFTSTELYFMDNPIRGGFDMLPNGTIYARGAGWDIWGQSDYAHFISNQISGINATFSMRLRSFVGYPTGYTWARTCLMIRKSLSPNSASFELCLTSGNNFVTQWRKTDNANKDGNFIMWDGTSKINSGWMTVTKNGDYYSAYISNDGVNWQQRGNTQYLPGLVNNNYFVGIAINSQSDRLAEAVIDNFLIAIPVAPTGDVSAVDKPVTAKPTTAKPLTSKPVISKPITTKPVTTKPITAKPVTAKPVTSKPITAKPVTTKPITAKPVTIQPITTKPVTAKPVTSKPLTTKPVTTKPITAKPVTAKPVTTNPVTAKPITAKPITAKPVTTKPVTAKPITAKPITAKPVPVITTPVTAPSIPAGIPMQAPIQPAATPAIAPVTKPTPLLPAAARPVSVTKPSPLQPAAKPINVPITKPAPSKPAPSKPAPSKPAPSKPTKPV